MAKALSHNTQAILLLTAPLLVSGGSPSQDLLSPREYKRLALRLRECNKQPSDLLESGASAILDDCREIIAPERAQRLLDRAFQLAQAVDRWQNRGIWVVSRADGEYPRRMKSRLREDAPAVLYGCGDISLLDRTALAVVGSRNVGPEMLEYAVRAGQLCAEAGRVLVSGGAKGVDQAAMRGALAHQGCAAGVMADSLERAVIAREHRALLMEERLVLVSPYDPAAGFNVGNAMQRNKLIYACADAALVVNTDFQKGGTWTGAVEQLDKMHLVSVYLRPFQPGEKGMEGLRRIGAQLWPESLNAKGLATLLAEGNARPVPEERGLDLTYEESASHTALLPPIGKEPLCAEEPLPLTEAATSPRETLFQLVRDLAKDLPEGITEDDFAKVLGVQKGQAKAWLRQLADVKAGKKASTEPGKPRRKANKTSETDPPPQGSVSSPPLFEG